MDMTALHAAATILEADHNQDGHLSPEEIQNAHPIIEPSEHILDDFYNAVVSNAYDVLESALPAARNAVAQGKPGLAIPPPKASGVTR